MSIDEQQLREHIERETAAYKQANPNWERDREPMREYLKSCGFSEDDVGQIYDHRALSVIRDAARTAAERKARDSAVQETKQAARDALKAAKESGHGLTPRQAGAFFTRMLKGKKVR